jgi:glycosyltransferase involved in cell wall biosynthesis
MKLLVIGAVPPPYHGVTAMNEILLRAVQQSKAFDALHLDISDHRPISAVEKFDWQNVWQAFSAGVRGLWQLLVWRPDIVYLAISQKALGFVRDALFLVPLRLLGRRVVVHLHGGNFHEFYRGASPLLRALIRFCLVRVRAAIVLGESLRKCFDGLVPLERIWVVPNGIPDFATACGRPAPSKRLRVLYLGTVVREKGSEVFVRAALKMLERMDAAEFIVAGPWFRESERDELLALIKAQGREADIRFIGQVVGDRKTEVLGAADVLVFPGVQQEGLPLVVLEAMCAGRAVIASDRGCLREVVVHGETGFVVPPGDVCAVVERLMMLAENRQLCAEMGAAGRRRYEECYQQEHCVQQILGVLEQAGGV